MFLSISIIYILHIWTYIVYDLLHILMCFLLKRTFNNLPAATCWYRWSSFAHDITTFRGSFATWPPQETESRESNISLKNHSRQRHEDMGLFCFVLFCLVNYDTVDGRNPANQLKGSLSHYLQCLCIPGGAGFLPSTVSRGFTSRF